MEEFSDVGKYLRLPLHQIKVQESMDTSDVILIESIAEKLKQNQRNFLPIIVEEVDENEYKVLLNSHIFEAATTAKLDFVWCILADEQRRKQIEIESQQRFEVNMLTASEETISRMLQYIKKSHSGWRIEPEKVAKVIVANRNEKWKERKPFIPLTKLNCGIGKTKLGTLNKYFCIN
ncbi:hypothetical protein [Mastigocoleus testarum]|uniref:ParB/Sulfiredoxin domain-containing protein n=1 Tax=Mastigocoleus testarum BC008 TaxID=371196 RepID=A0A0V7ZYM4_9CYAN|nr:hypothetical protein [Mastigocoleus testarum]KST69684.1 hypothetical protein BC008_05135 [Mastigocoleus testarum BC008]KST69692.1 hypothetical protein BC008_05150 [Mastigocoleus testarum BC008]